MLPRNFGVLLTIAALRGPTHSVVGESNVLVKSAEASLPLPLQPEPRPRCDVVEGFRNIRRAKYVSKLLLGKWPLGLVTTGTRGPDVLPFGEPSTRPGEGMIGCHGF